MPDVWRDWKEAFLMGGLIALAVIVVGFIAGLCIAWVCIAEIAGD